MDFIAPVTAGAKGPPCRSLTTGRADGAHRDRVDQVQLRGVASPTNGGHAARGLGQPLIWKKNGLWGNREVWWEFLEKRGCARKPRGLFQDLNGLSDLVSDGLNSYTFQLKSLHFAVPCSHRAHNPIRGESIRVTHRETGKARRPAGGPAPEQLCSTAPDID